MPLNPSRNFFDKRAALALIFMGLTLIGRVSIAKSPTSNSSADASVAEFLRLRNLEKSEPSSTETANKICAGYEKLKSQAIWSLARLARVRQLVLCPNSYGFDSFEASDSELDWLGPWLNEAVDRTGRNAKSSPETRLQAYLLSSKLGVEQKFRLVSIENGLQIAREMDFDDWIRKFEKQ